MSEIDIDPTHAVCDDSRTNGVVPLGYGVYIMKSIMIQGVNFDAPSPYNAGHTLSAVEADVLNQTYAENLRNNFANTVKDWKATHGEKLPQHAIESLRDEFEAYAKDYQFGVRRGGEIDPVRLVRNKAANLTDEQKAAIAESLGLEFKPKKKVA